jgi:RND family efflux transporter MFP subunit
MSPIGTIMKRYFFLLVMVIVAGFIGWKVYDKVTSAKENSGGSRGVVPVAVEIVPVRKTSIKRIGTFTGSLFPKSQFVVAPKIAGRLEKLFLNIGDRVKEGQLVAALDNDEYLQQVDQARAEMEVARATLEESRSALETSKRELERTVALRKKKIASESEMDAAKAEYTNQEAKLKVAVAQVSQKQAALKAAQVRLSYTQIRVSWNDQNGSRVVGERFVDEGAMLAPNTPLLSVLDISSMIAAVHVIERDYSMVRVGQDATVATDAFPGKSFFGRIVRIAPLLKETSREARVEIDIPNPEDLLKPGMFARVRIEFEEHADATVVPLSALVKREGQQGVFLADTEQKKARFVPVTTGIMQEKDAEILSPPLSGSVVTLGHHLLEDGSEIILAGKGRSRSGADTAGTEPSGRDGESGSGTQP